MNETKTITLSVPAGDYVASASRFAVNASATTASDIECRISAPGNANYGVIDLTVPAHPTGTTDNYTVPQAETALTIGTGGGVISYECGANGTEPTQLYQARIVATQVESLTTS